jgi:signal transduction histidine kinase
VRGPRSIIFYAWAGLAVQSVLVAGVIAFVLVGASYQRGAIEHLHRDVQAFSIANLVMQADFLDAQRAARGYQATGEAGLLREHAAARRLSWAAVMNEFQAEERTARAAIAADDEAITLRRGGPAANRLYDRASADALGFNSDADRLQQYLGQQGDVLAGRSARILGVGLGWTAAILALGLMLPVIAVAVGLRWVSGPLHAATSAIRQRALGDSTVRAVPGGPADVRELAMSINFLADESDRVRAREQERARLQGEVHQASVRIREHLRGEAIIREAVTAIHEHLAVDYVQVGIVSGERLTLTDDYSDSWGQVAHIVGYFPPDSVGWMREIYRHRSSYRVQDLREAQAGEIPPEIEKVMVSQNASSLLLTPFGAGQELLGCLTLLRTGPGRGWTQPEIEAVESLAGDIGQGLEHARLYESEERLVAELKSLDLAKSSFLASASHDLRTPLTSIIGYVEMLTDREAGPVSAAQARMLDAVSRNVRRLKTMIEDMLTISKIELGAFASRLHPLDLNGLVPIAADVIRPSAAAGGLAFEVNYPDHGIIVDGDPEQLDRVLVNLLSNAVKYTPRGGKVSLTAGSTADAAVLTIADTGIGIPAADQASLFTRFFRASNAVEAAIPGSGLGLSIVRTIVANHHGELTVESEQDHGTTVTVRIPLQGRAPAPGPAATEPAGHR